MTFMIRWPTQDPEVRQYFLEGQAEYSQFSYTGVDGHVHPMPGNDGISIAAAYGDDVFACMDGVVVAVDIEGDVRPYGNRIHVEHVAEEAKYETIYCHLSSANVEMGQKVRTGDIIGKVGESGSLSGPQLRLLVRKTGATHAGETVFETEDLREVKFYNDTINPATVLKPSPPKIYAYPQHVANASSVTETLIRTPNFQAKVKAAALHRPNYPLRGLHGPGAAAYWLEQGVKAWAVEKVYSNGNLDDTPTVDFSEAAAEGIRVVACWNHSLSVLDGGEGTFGNPQHDAKFIDWVVRGISTSKGVWGHVIGNEPNCAHENHDYVGPTDIGTPILPERVAEIFNAVRDEVAQPVLLAPPAIDSTNTENWLKGERAEGDVPLHYWRRLLKLIKRPDFFALHAYSYAAQHDAGREEMFQEAPLEWQYRGFKMWEPLAQAIYNVGDAWSRIPIVITEANHQYQSDGRIGWDEDAAGWIARVYAYVKQWNQSSDDQYVHGVVMHQLDGSEWRMVDKPKLLAALRESGAQAL